MANVTNRVIINTLDGTQIESYLYAKHFWVNLLHISDVSLIIWPSHSTRSQNYLEALNYFNGFRRVNMHVSFERTFLLF